jgi:hypothetical protein
MVRYNFYIFLYIYSKVIYNTLFLKMSEENKLSNLCVIDLLDKIKQDINLSSLDILKKPRRTHDIEFINLIHNNFISNTFIKSKKTRT